tara:strand:- start:399 stop:503 length:105 start_codon:yes stop_codon:yes gene_type:complete
MEVIKTSRFDIKKNKKLNFATTQIGAFFSSLEEG